MTNLHNTFKIKNCSFIDNSARKSGGGLEIHNFEHIEIDRSEFTHNDGSKGGSIYTDTKSNSSNLVLTNTKAVKNLGDEGGFLFS